MFRRRTAVLALIVATTATAFASNDQIRLPRLPRSIPTDIPRLDRLPSLDDLIGRQPLTSSLTDAVTEVPLLDRFDPDRASPLLELPMGLDDGVTLVPGLWDALLQSYCLKAGTYGPTKGDGYLWAPLKGPKADVINTILTKSAFFPALPQHDVQVLLWGIIARTHVSAMGEGPRRVAQQLLNESQLASIDGSALDVIPDDWIRRITGPLDAVARRALEAENRLRQAFANPGAAAYQELERLAVLNGVPPLPERGRDVPAKRWSFHPNGYFIRFMPNSYTNMHLQIYVPERFSAARAAGRLSTLSDAAGSEIQITYGPDGAIAAATFRVAEGAPHPVAIRSGEAIVSAARDAARDALRFVGSARQQSARSRDVQDVSMLLAAVQDPDAAQFLSRAFASAVGDWAREAPGQARVGFADPRTMQASAGGTWFARPIDELRLEQAGLSGGWGGGGGGGSGGGGGGGGGMPGGGRQRLGPSLRKFNDGDNAASRARNAIDKINTAKNVMDLGEPAGLLGFGIPDALFGKILDFNFDSWGKATDALAGDPPRSDFREFTEPKIGEIPQLKAGGALTQARADLLNALARDLITTNAYLQAAQIAMDRHGGAVQANQREWASRQAQALTYLKREAGVRSLKVAADLDALESGTNSRTAAAIKDAAEAMRDLGTHFASLPVIDAPWKH